MVVQLLLVIENPPPKSSVQPGLCAHGYSHILYKVSSAMEPWSAILKAAGCTRHSETTLDYDRITELLAHPPHTPATREQLAPKFEAELFERKE